MVQIKNVLYPIDFSDNNLKILPYVKLVTTNMGADLHLINVIRDLNNYAGFYVPHSNLEGLIQDIATEADKRLQEFVEQNLADIEKVNTRVVTGYPANEIVKYVKEAGIDLVVMGTHGRTGIDRAIFGSVAEKVVKHSPAPVMTVNPHYV